MCSNDDWGKTTIQTEDVAITEEDLELIKERETAIQQLEVSFRLFFLNPVFTGSMFRVPLVLDHFKENHLHL